MTEIILTPITTPTGGIQHMTNGQLCDEHKNVTQFLSTVNPDDAEFWNLFDYQEDLRIKLNGRNISIIDGKYYKED